MSPAATSESQRQKQKPATTEIEITANGDRRALEAIYLELRDLAKRTGLKIEYRLGMRPGESADS